MITSDVIVVYLANLMFNEPTADGVLGQRACGLVVRNRVNAGWGDWIKMIQEHDKYSANAPTSLSDRRNMVIGDPIRDENFRRCLEIAANIYNGIEKDITKGALRYARLDKCSEEFAEKVVRPTRVNPENGCTELVHNRVATIGQQQFFI
jgi:Cell Wall Hydrolase